MKRDQEEPDKVDSGWDTDYDPKDKYYLSADDDPFDLYSTERKQKKTKRTSSTKRERSRERRSPSKGRGPSRHGTSPARASSSHAPSHSHSRSRHPGAHHHSSHRSHSPSRPREETKTSTSKHKDAAAPTSSSSRSARPSSTNHAAPSRPKASRASSSYHGTSRPRMNRAGSSTYASVPRSSRPRPVRMPSSGGSSRQPLQQVHAAQAKIRSARDLARFLDPDELQRLLEEFPWEEAGKVALQAGTVAAIKVGTDSVPWPVKGTKIASAALGAAVVDHVLRPKKKGGIKYAAMRHLAEVAMGNMVVGPALGRASSSSGGGGGSGGSGGKSSSSRR